MLSDQDTLRINVLLANNVKAIRIDENNMTIYGLMDDEEAKLTLSPNCKNELYLKKIREFLSGHILGSPGGYPVYLKRWTRMGQAKDDSLADLLMLGEPEAVVAVACATGLTDILASRIWWIEQDAENARRMLHSDDVVKGTMGAVLADFLVEFLPFEAEPENIINSVRLVLQPGLISDDTRQKIWDIGKNKKIYRIGFLLQTPDDLPEKYPPRKDLELYKHRLSELERMGNPYAAALLKALDTAGQSFLHAVSDALKKPASQEAVIALFDALGNYFNMLNPDMKYGRNMDEVFESVMRQTDDPEGELAQLLTDIPDLKDELQAVLVLSRISEQMVLPVFATTTASGTLLRRKLEPITSRLVNEINCLLEQK